MSKIKIFALGGLNENGKNMYVVEVNKDIFIFDAGLKYADERMLGVDYIIPNFDYIKENKDKIKGIFITHGHDEQMGALPDILKEVRIPIYGTNFTINRLKQDLKSLDIKDDMLKVIKPHQKIKFKENSIFPISLTHSIPDAVGYVLYTEDGAIFYTGNFVFDSAMMKNYKTDIGKLAYVGKQGVLALLSESLYADRKGYTSPNHRTASKIRESFNKYSGRIIFNTYQNELYRIQELLSEIAITRKKIVILGKKTEEMIKDAIAQGYIDFPKNKIAPIKNINDKDIVVLVTDEREKPYSNLKKIVKGYDKFLKLTEEDTVLFAATIYDGLEKTASNIFDNIAKIGCDLVVFKSKEFLDHHASKEDLMLMLDLMKPKYYVPVIGEYRHQVENFNIAKQLGMDDKNILLKANGETILFEGGKLSNKSEKIKIDDILIDGITVGDVGELVIRDRESLSEDGIVIVTVAIDRRTKKVLAGPEILTRGFIYVKDNLELIKTAEKLALEVINENKKPTYVDFNKIKSGVRDKLGKYLYKETACRPMILVVINEV